MLKRLNLALLGLVASAGLVFAESTPFEDAMDAITTEITTMFGVILIAVGGVCVTVLGVYGVIKGFKWIRSAMR